MPLQRLLEKHVATPCKSCPSLAAKKVTPHTLRHTGTRYEQCFAGR